MTYCRTLTDYQVKNVLCDEADRYHRHEGQGEVAVAAMELYHEAREELQARGINPDDILRENGIKIL
jgi:hypothetical protein